MIVLVTSDVELGRKLAFEYVNELIPGVRAVPERYPERNMLRTHYAQYVEEALVRHQKLGDCIILTDNELLVEMFQLAIFEGRLRAEDMKLVANEVKEVRDLERTLYRFDSDGRYANGHPEFCNLRRGILRRML